MLNGQTFDSLMEPYQVLSQGVVRVVQKIMSTKEYFTILKATELQPHHQMI